MIYSKFKEQINQHLQDCKSSFEGLEEEQKEFKVTLEKRSKSFISCTACRDNESFLCFLNLSSEMLYFILIQNDDVYICPTESSHRKLVLQVEECVEVQLNEAQKKITATHEASYSQRFCSWTFMQKFLLFMHVIKLQVARKKMAQLKQVLGSCLKDDLLS